MSTYKIQRVNTGGVKIRNSVTNEKVMLVPQHMAVELAEFFAAEQPQVDPDAATDGELATLEMDWDWSAAYPISYAEPDGLWEIYHPEPGDDQLDEVRSFVRFVNSRAVKQGFRAVSYVQRRAIIRAPWEKVTVI